MVNYQRRPDDPCRIKAKLLRHSCRQVRLFERHQLKQRHLHSSSNRNKELLQNPARDCHYSGNKRDTVGLYKIVIMSFLQDSGSISKTQKWENKYHDNSNAQTSSVELEHKALCHDVNTNCRKQLTAAGIITASKIPGRLHQHV